MDTCRIEVDLAQSIGSEALPRPWSKYSSGSSAFDKRQKHQHEKEEKKLNEKQKDFLKDMVEMDDPKLQEFLQVMKPTDKKTWGNDDVLAVGNHHKAIPTSADDELYEDLPMAAQEEAVVQEQVDEELPETDNVAFDENISDMEYLRQKMKQPEQGNIVNVHPSRLAILNEEGAIEPDQVINIYNQEKSVEAPDFEPKLVQESDESPAEVVEAESEPEPIPPADLIADTGRIMVRNIPYSCSQEDIEEHFKKFGPIAEAHIPISKETKSSRGYAFILYCLPEHAVNAFVACDKSIFQGRIIDVVPAKEKPKSLDELPTGPQTFKAMREKELKSKSTNEFNWNSLFMNVYTFNDRVMPLLMPWPKNSMSKRVIYWIPLLIIWL